MKPLGPALVLVCLFAAQGGEAAPFCLQRVGVPEQCLFHDVNQCGAEARRLNAVCALNAKEVALPQTGDRFCLVRNGPVVECLYPERRSCDAAAGRSRGGICVDAGGPFSRPDPDLIPR